MNIVYIGSGKFGIDCLNALEESHHVLNTVVTAGTKPSGRGRKPKSTPVAQWANENDIPLYETDNVNSPDSIERIAVSDPELIVVIAFGQKISREVIELADKKAINIHASLLPKYRGAAPVNWTIINGEKVTGISIITLAEKMDAGDIIATKATEIKPQETAGELEERLAGLASEIFVDTLNKIESGTAEYKKQEHSKATLAPKLKKADGFLDFTQPAEKIERLIRGVCPWPGGQAEYFSREKGKRFKIKITLAEPVKKDTPQNLSPGTLDEDLEVICGEGALRIKRIKPEGSRLMDFSDFVNGRACKPGDMLLKIDR